MLRGVGATLALPLLDAMIPAAGLARSAMGAAARQGSPIPLRMAAIFQGIVGRVRDGTAANANAAAVAGQVRPMAEVAWAYARRAGA